MELISDNSEVAIAGSLQVNYTPNQISITANEDVAATSETIIDNPEHVVLDKTLVVKKKIVVKEKVIIPKSITYSNNCEVPSDVQADLSSTTIELLRENETLTDEMDFTNHASQESKMEIGSQESGTMDICSQESIFSKMELCSQESSLTLDSDLKYDPLSIDRSAEQELVGKIPINIDDLFEEDNLRRKKRIKLDENDSFDKLHYARATSLSIREKAVSEREAAVSSREKLIQSLENAFEHSYQIKHCRSKQRKRVKFNY